MFILLLAFQTCWTACSYGVGWELGSPRTARPSVTGEHADARAAITAIPPTESALRICDESSSGRPNSSTVPARPGPVGADSEMMCRTLPRLLRLTMAVWLLVACSQGQGTVGNAKSPSAAPTPSTGLVGPSPSPRASAAPTGSVFVIVMENHSYAEAMAQPYTAALA